MRSTALLPFVFASIILASTIPNASAEDPIPIQVFILV
jgi:hypothetical protein